MMDLIYLAALDTETYTKNYSSVYIVPYVGYNFIL